MQKGLYKCGYMCSAKCDGTEKKRTEYNPMCVKSQKKACAGLDKWFTRHQEAPTISYKSLRRGEKGEEASFIFHLRC